MRSDMTQRNNEHRLVDYGIRSPRPLGAGGTGRMRVATIAAFDIVVSPNFPPELHTRYPS